MTNLRKIKSTCNVDFHKYNDLFVRLVWFADGGREAGGGGGDGDPLPQWKSTVPAIFK